MEKLLLNIIVPCYNPLNGWEKNLLTNFNLFKHQIKECDVGLILVNDGSTKNISQSDISFLENNLQHFCYIEYKKNKGKGSALRLGVKKSTAKYIVFTDVDFPYETTSILAIYDSLKKGADISLGFRSANYYSKTPLIRMLISKTFRYLLKVFLRLRATDTQCGLKGFNHKGKKEFLQTTIDRFLFDLEFVKRCSQRKALVIKPVSVTLKENVVFSQMNFKILAAEFLNFLMILVKK